LPGKRGEKKGRRGNQDCSRRGGRTPHGEAYERWAELANTHAERRGTRKVKREREIQKTEKNREVRTVPFCQPG